MNSRRQQLRAWVCLLKMNPRAYKTRLKSAAGALGGVVV
jgi:hypothetical protein